MKIALDHYYSKVELPDFTERMENMLQTDKELWDDTNKRYQFIQFLASYYYHQTSFTLDNKVIGYIYQPVCQKLLEKYANLRVIINEVCIKLNASVIKGAVKNRKKLYQPWVNFLEILARNYMYSLILNYSI